MSTATALFVKVASARSVRVPQKFYPHLLVRSFACVPSVLFTTKSFFVVVVIVVVVVVVVVELILF